MNTNILTIVKKITMNSRKRKGIRQVLKYVLLDGTKIVATDTSCMFVVTVENQGEKRLLDLNNPLNLNLNPAEYAQYERIIPKYNNGLRMGENDDIVYILSDMYKSGVVFNYKYIELLLSSKGVYKNLEYFHDRENLNNPVMITGTLDGYDFIFVFMPIAQR